MQSIDSKIYDQNSSSFAKELKIALLLDFWNYNNSKVE